jgi:hypothetical protein
VNVLAPDEHYLVVAENDYADPDVRVINTHFVRLIFKHTIAAKLYS